MVAPVRSRSSTRDEVGVEVRQEHVGDAQPVFGRETDIAVDIALRVDDGGDSGLFVTDDVGGVRQAIEVELL